MSSEEKGNRAGDASSVAAFSGSATGGAAGGSVAGSLSWVRGAEGGADIAVTFQLVGSGEWSFVAVYDGGAQAQAVGSPAGLLVLPAGVSAPDCSFSCPSSVASSATASCLVSARDAFGNPSSSGADFALEVLVGAAQSAVYGTVGGSGSVGAFTAAYAAPVTDHQPVQLVLTLLQAGVRVGGANPQNVTVEPAAVSSIAQGSPYQPARAIPCR